MMLVHDAKTMNGLSITVERPCTPPGDTESSKHEQRAAKHRSLNVDPHRGRCPLTLDEVDLDYAHHMQGSLAKYKAKVQYVAHFRMPGYADLVSSQLKGPSKAWCGGTNIIINLHTRNNINSRTSSGNSPVMSWTNLSVYSQFVDAY
jgi:hypothetical protein